MHHLIPLRRLVLGVAPFGLAVLIGGSAARAQDKPAGGAPPAPVPAPELAGLKPLAGSWSCQGVAPAGSMGPGSPEVKYQSSFKVTALHGGFGYELAYAQKKSKDHPMRFEGAWNTGWDASRKKLAWFWLDNMGDVGAQTSPPWEGDTLVIEGEGAALGRHALLRDTFTRKGDKQLHWKGELKPDGAPGWITIGEDDCKK
jgi:hypothetical protein